MRGDGSPDGRSGWRSIQEEVRRVVDAEDPEGVLAAGAPADEYTSEVQALVGLVLRGPVTADGVLAIWARWFGPESGLNEPARLDRLAGELAEIRRRYVSDVYPGSRSARGVGRLAARGPEEGGQHDQAAPP